MADGAAELGRRLVEAVWAASDQGAAAATVATAVVVHHSRAVAPGPDGQAAVGDYFRAGFPDARWAVEDVVAAGDKAAVRWRMTGRHDGPFEGVAPTGREAELAGILIVRVEGGKIAEIWHAEGMLGLLDRIGAKPEGTARG
ncbi:MAG: ester cyclase [Chloroflexia bacterium]|nr:ester cyclase [Chloroflexia bacterium]